MPLTRKVEFCENEFEWEKDIVFTSIKVHNIQFVKMFDDDVEEFDDDV